MPFLFLSPSTQEFNPYVTTGNEEYWMNQLADRMEPYLFSSGINVIRNDPSQGAAGAILQSNAGYYDFHLALHSNASAPARAGRQRGVDAYYYYTSEDGLRMANILVDNIKPIYPLPDLVRAQPTAVLGELRRTRAPSVLIELGYHDNEQDANWLTGNLDTIAAALSVAVSEYFGLPFVAPTEPRQGIVTLSQGELNLRSYPTVSAAAIVQIPNGAALTILGEYDGWYTVEYNGLYGFVYSDFVTLV